MPSLPEKETFLSVLVPLLGMHISSSFILYFKGCYVIKFYDAILCHVGSSVRGPMRPPLGPNSPYI
jgi:hypothetical protein